MKNNALFKCSYEVYTTFIQSNFAIISLIWEKISLKLQDS